MANRKMSTHVEFEKDITDFIPYDAPISPCKTAASSESIDNKRVFYDEIALLKRHYITRDGSQKDRKMGVAPKTSEAAPISAEELKKRGIRLENGKVIHSLPTSYNSSDSSASSVSSIKSNRTSSNTRSFISRASTVQSRVSMFEAAVTDESYKVGLPCENARLKVCKLKKGERLELTIEGHGVCAVEISDKQSTLISYKD